MRVGVLGPLEVRDEAGNLVPVGGARLRSLLIRLAVGDGRPVSVERLADDLWEDGGPADAANAIQALVSRLRGAAGRNVVEYGPAGYRLAVPAGQVDARAFEQLVAAAREALAHGDRAGGAVALRQALALWRGPALSDVADAPFAAAPITRLSELRLAAAEDLFDAELESGRGSELVPELEELAGAHPLRERLRGQLMRALYAAGRQADALGAYEDTRRVLSEQLGIDPSPGLAAVHLAILRGEPAATAAPEPPGFADRPGFAAGPGRLARPGPGGPAGAAGPRMTNLPAQLTSFVGREEELRRLAKLLAESRLVTLTGPGGAGKTRLSVETAARMADELPDGIWFVPLAPVRDALDVPQAVLTALGLNDTSWSADPVEAARLAAQQLPLDRLADALASRQLILVLDNCEHLVDAIAWLTARVLADAPGVRILATSREPLGITGETLCPVPSLQLPPEGASAEEAAQYPAIALFADRAAAVRPGFVLGPAVLEPVSRICRALDGIPLAIELAAARLRALTADQVADRLDDRFRLLSVGSRGALPRHQTLRAIVDWSWELLDDAERTVLRRLSVFSGGATPDSAEIVCALAGAGPPGTAGPAGIDPGAVIEIVASLVDKSLVTATGEQQVRYRLLETVRAYAADRLAEAGEAERARDAHAAYFLGLAEQGEPMLRTREQVSWLDRLTAEHDNCAAGLRHALDAADVATALRFIRALAWFWLLRDYESEASAWAATAAELAGDTPPDGLEDAYALCALFSMIGKARPEFADHRPEFPDQEQVTRLMRQVSGLAAGSTHPMLVLARAVVSVLTGDLDAARRVLTEISGHPDPWLAAAALMFGGFLAVNDGDIDAAGAAVSEGHAAFVEIGDRWMMAISLNGMAQVAMARDEPAEAVRLLEEARVIASTGGLAMNWSEMMNIQLGHARAATGDLSGARADIERGLGAAGRLGEHDDEAAGYIELSELARRGGDPAAARKALGQALEVIEPRAGRMEMSGVAATAYTKSGCLAEQDGDLAGAARWHARALAVLADPKLVAMPSNPTLAAVVEGIAALAAARGEHARAAELLGLARALQGFHNPGSLETARAAAAATAALGQDAFDAAYARGRRLGRADALALTP
ncbi:MAG TPA: BTAD domain-containing putative transcriptional regulator [Streptosporangiaceae bacterium]|nr:BTAD domain-containing putative transcriptional regulator [Streptosporangiaceae bacterium]